MTNIVEISKIELAINPEANEVYLNRLDFEVSDLSEYLSEMFTADNDTPAELKDKLDEMYEEAQILRKEIKKIREAEDIFADAERLVRCRR